MPASAGVFPEEFVAAGVEALTRILTQHSRSAFGASRRSN